MTDGVEKGFSGVTLMRRRGRDSSIWSLRATVILQALDYRYKILSVYDIIRRKIDFFDSIDPVRNSLSRCSNRQSAMCEIIW
jgi:hypothetical protein